MKAQDRNKASRHAPIVELATALRRTGPDQIDELLETPMDDADQLQQLRGQLCALYDLAGAAFQHVVQLQDNAGVDPEDVGALLERARENDPPPRPPELPAIVCHNCGEAAPRLVCRACIAATLEQLMAPRMPAAPFKLAELENVQPRPWRVDRASGGLAGVVDAQDVVVFAGVTLEEAALIVRAVNAAP